MKHWHFRVLWKIFTYPKYELQWCDKPTAYALQTTVRDIAVHDRTFVKYRSLQEMFPPKSVCFMLGHPLYGAMGEASMRSLPNVNACKEGYICQNLWMLLNRLMKFYIVEWSLCWKLLGEIYFCSVTLLEAKIRVCSLSPNLLVNKR